MSKLKTTKLKNLLKGAVKNIVGSKMRSFLTMLGLVIGIASVIVLVGIGNGTSSKVASEVQSLGTNVLTVKISSDDTALDYEQLSSLRELQNVESTAPYKSVSGTVSRESTSATRASLIASTPDYLDVMGLTISAGRVMSEIDLENYSKVCLLGNDMAEDLFALGSPVGQSIKINGDNYTVIGVLTAVGSSMGSNVDDTIIIPFTTAKYLGSDTSISDLYVKIMNDSLVSQTTGQIENFIERTLDITDDYYSVSSQDSMLNTADSVNNTMSLLLGGIASISLIVGGIGVMNVMLVSVTERTKEIGIRKALGAKRKDILFQFLIEALLLCLVGGLIGVVLGMGIGGLLGQMGYAFIPNAGVVIIAFISSALIGMAFGIFPASKAAKLNPIDALHAE